jgi:hypothetical protein
MKFGKRASVSTEIGWKEIFFFQEGRFEGEFLFSGRKVGRIASVSKGKRLEGELLFTGMKF